MASISLARVQEYADFCEFRPLKVISIDTGVLCGTNYASVLFRESMRRVEGDVDEFGATS
jgi:hypothetical protein